MGGGEERGGHHPHSMRTKSKTFLELKCQHRLKVPRVIYPHFRNTGSNKNHHHGYEAEIMAFLTLLFHPLLQPCMDPVSPEGRLLSDRLCFICLLELHISFKQLLTTQLFGDIFTFSTQSPGGGGGGNSRCLACRAQSQATSTEPWMKRDGEDYH